MEDRPRPRRLGVAKGIQRQPRGILVNYSDPAPVFL